MAARSRSRRRGPHRLPSLLGVSLLNRQGSFQMTFHTGHALAQTVYTVLHLQPSSLDALALSSTFPLPESSEQEALRLALRAGMLGLGKSTELVWQELNKGNVFDVSPSALSCQMGWIGAECSNRARTSLEIERVPNSATTGASRRSRGSCAGR